MSPSNMAKSHPQCLSPARHLTQVNISQPIRRFCHGPWGRYQRLVCQTGSLPALRLCDHVVMVYTIHHGRPTGYLQTTNLPSLSKAKLKQLIEEAVVDAHNEEEQTVGFLTMMQEHLALPFSVNILGVEVVVEKVDMTRDGQIVAICRRENVRQRIGIVDLPLPRPAPTGAEWIAAYHHWRREF
jgi:Calcium binding